MIPDSFFREFYTPKIYKMNRATTGKQRSENRKNKSERKMKIPEGA
jgi:hypothetical protein